MVPHWWNLPDPPSRVPDKPPTARWLTPSNVPGAAGSLHALLPRLLTEPDLWACRGKHPEGPDPLSQGRKKGEPRAAGRCTKDKLETSAGTSSQRPSRNTSQVRVSSHPCPSPTSLHRRWPLCALPRTQAGSGRCTAARRLAFCGVSRGWPPRPCPGRASSFAVRSALTVFSAAGFPFSWYVRDGSGVGLGQTREPWPWAARGRVRASGVRVWFPRSVSRGFCQTFRYCNLLGDRWYHPVI